MNDKYVKIVYQSDPIGEEKIILYLTTFDMEAFKKDEKMKEIPIKKQAIVHEYNKEYFKEPNFIEGFEENVNAMIKGIYEQQLKEMKEIIETYRKLNKPIAMPIESKIKNISNSGDVHCDVVYGNITNCDNVYCNEVKGNVVNCDGIIYKKEEMK